MQPSSLMRGTHSVAPRAADTRSCQNGRHKIGRANALDCPGSSAGPTAPVGRPYLFGGTSQAQGMGQTAGMRRI